MEFPTKAEVDTRWAEIELAILRLRAAVGDANKTIGDVLEWQEDAMERLSGIVRRFGHPTAQQLRAAAAAAAPEAYPGQRALETKVNSLSLGQLVEVMETLGIKPKIKRARRRKAR